MADTQTKAKVESPVEKKKVEEKEKLIEAKEQKEEDSEDKTENGNADAKDEEEKTEKKPSEKEVPAADKCATKRKSAGGDAVDGKACETTPEKKAKVDDASPEAESNGDTAEAEVAA